MSAEPDRKERFQLRSSILTTELEQNIFSLVAQPLYETKERKQIRTKGLASDEEIDAVLTSPEMKRALRRSVEAFLQQQLPSTLGRIFEGAEGKEAWACRLILELTGIADLLRAAVSQTEGEIQEARVISELERGLVESFRQLVKGEGREEEMEDNGRK